MDTTPDPWFAGFFDADGSVSIARGSGTSYFLLSLAVVQVDAAPLLLFKERFDGKVTGPHRGVGNRRPIFTWRADARIAEIALEAMLPWLVVKRERGELALEFRSLFRGENVLPRGPADQEKHANKRSRVLTEREACYRRMAVLNKRGTS